MQNDPILHPMKKLITFLHFSPCSFLRGDEVIYRSQVSAGPTSLYECPVCEVDKLDIPGLLHGNGTQAATQDTEPLGLTFIIHPLFQLLRIHKWVNPLMKSEHA